ncbi:MAG: Crp/Fnr family transcriptional regulator [Candidatus Saccharimonadales bacterium]
MLASEAQLAKLIAAFHSGTRVHYKKGEFIIRPGEIPPGVFYIEQGLVKAYDITKYGEENLLIIRKEQEIFPLIWALSGQEHKVIYQALAPVLVWRLDRPLFLEFICDPVNPLAPLLDMTLEMYRIHSERIFNLEYRTVRERLISFLLTMAKRFGEHNSDGSILINVPLRQQDIASSINASRETAGRELTILERKDLVSSSQFLLTLKDPKTLRKFL